MTVGAGTVPATHRILIKPLKVVCRALGGSLSGHSTPDQTPDQQKNHYGKSLQTEQLNIPPTRLGLGDCPT